MYTEDGECSLRMRSVVWELDCSVRMGTVV